MLVLFEIEIYDMPYLDRDMPYLRLDCSGICVLITKLRFWSPESFCVVFAVNVYIYTWRCRIYCFSFIVLLCTLAHNY